MNTLDCSKADAKRSENATFSGAFLGNYAEFTPPFKNNDLQTSVIKSSKWDFDAQISERYALQIQARKSLLELHYSFSDSEKPKKAHRVCNCRRDLRPVHVGKENGKNIYEMPKHVGIFQHKETKNTFYGGLAICGSVYACPVCAPKIAETRASEIRIAVMEWVKNGGICLFITLTFPHYACDTIASSIASLKSSLTIFRKGEKYDNLMASLGHIGLIKATETTWGESNGWHPHSHEIWFVRPEYIYEIYPDLDKTKKLPVGLLTDIFDSELKPELFEYWSKACVESGLSKPSYQRGMVIKACETEEEMLKRIAEYLAKTGIEKPAWGVDDELTKLHSKRGKPDRYTPFDFLRKQYDVEATKKEKYRFRFLFSEFVTAFKGTAKVYWSKGLKAQFQIKVITDKQAAQDQTESASLLLGVRPPIWVFVIGINDHRAQLLTKIKNEGVEPARQWLKTLLDSYADYFPDQEKFELLATNHQYILNYLSEV